MALAASAFAALATFLSSEKRSEAKFKESAAWFGLEDSARNMLDFKLHDDRWLMSGAEQDIDELRREQSRLVGRPAPAAGEGRS